MYKIGDFSKIVDIPVRTLRYYAEYGVLVPSEIDKFTGYKYYSEANVIECELIKLLKSLDFTLDEIIEYNDRIDEDGHIDFIQTNLGLKVSFEQSMEFQMWARLKNWETEENIIFKENLTSFKSR